MTFLSIIQIISAIFLILVILLQQKGAGLGATFGGSSNIYSTKRGVEKVLFKATIITSFVFFGVSFLQVIL